MDNCVLKTTFLVKLLNTTVSVAEHRPQYTLNILIALWINCKVPVTVVIMAGIQDSSAIIHTKEREAIKSLEQLCDE
jgi:hypothetical protein